MWHIVIAGGLILLIILVTKGYAVDLTPPASIVPPTPDPDFRENRLEAFAKAIATAEGYYRSDSLPNRNNNPGALRLYGETITYFHSPEIGWSALYSQIQRILDGRSAYYSTSMTIERMALIWTGFDNSQAWANTVSAYLGISPQSTIGEIFT